jgi:hypothetical protein
VARWIAPMLFILVGCDSTKASQPAQTGEWRCFVMDPKTPELLQGNVTHTKQRLHDGRLETQNVHIQAGRAGSTRLVYRPVGDHLEATLGAGTIVARLEAPDATRWTLHYRDASGWEFTDEFVIDDTGLTITSIDPKHELEIKAGAKKGSKKTVVRFLPASCDVVDAELAKHPE